VEVFADSFALPAGVGAGTRLLDDLGFDSLQMFEIALLLEDTGGHIVPDGVLNALVTIGDVYDTYVLYSGHRPG